VNRRHIVWALASTALLAMLTELGRLKERAELDAAAARAEELHARVGRLELELRAALATDRDPVPRELMADRLRRGAPAIVPPSPVDELEAELAGLDERRPS
jgi:hypothetical protein